MASASDNLVDVFYSSKPDSDSISTEFNEFKIIGGKDASYGEWPWQISLQMKVSGK